MMEKEEDLKKEENLLNEMENKYRKIFENIQDIYYRTDLNGIILEVSPSVKKYSDYFDTDLPGHSIEDYYYDPEDRQRIIQKIYSEGEIFDAEVRLKGKNNSILWASINAHLTFDKDKQVTGIEGMVRDITDRKETEDKLKHSLSLLQATLDSTTEGILAVDTSGKITNFNNQFKVLFGIPDQILESADDIRAIEFVSTQFKDPSLFTSKVQFLYNHPELDSFDTLELNDGRVLERNSCPQRFDGEPIGRVWSFKNVTLRKKAESQLQLMAHAIKDINEFVSITDINDKLIFVNQAFLNQYGFTEDELIGKDISIVRSPKNDPEVINQILKNTQENGWQGEIWNRKKDGTDFPIFLSTTTVKNNNEEIVGMVGVATDITEKKKIENELRESEQKYRNLIEIMPDGVYRSTPEGKFVEVNPAMVHILGYESKEELMAIDIKTQLYFDPADRESLSLKMNNEELDVYPLKKKDGSAVYVEDHGWWVKNEKGDVVFHEGISRDVTERKMAEFQLQKYSQELQELNATKDKFFSIIAHDLKSPFNSITGLSELIKKEAKFMDVATIEQFAGVIHSTSASTFRLLENLLEWASVQQSKIAFQPETVILKKIVSEVIELSIEKATSKKIKVINDIPEGMIIMADENMLKTVLRNLLSNALKFTRANGEVSIMVISKNEQIEIQVKDNGIGIKSEDLDKIFKIGSNYSQRGTENEKGTGIGLMLCKEFVEKHGGKIWVESEEGKGSTFAFTIKQIGL